MTSYAPTLQVEFVVKDQPVTLGHMLAPMFTWMNPAGPLLLSDGSVCVITPTGSRSSLISREVDGQCVWGQSFARNEDAQGSGGEG